MKPRIYVITGAPCTGKTSVIEELERRGYKVLQEGAAEIGSNNGGFAGKSEIGGTGFNREVFEFRKSQLEVLEGEGVVFSDRGVGDSLAYYQIQESEIPKGVLDYIKQINYSGIFVLEPLGFYETNEKRWTPEEKQKEMQEVLIEVYKELGYDLVFVPLLSVGERVDFILSKIIF